MNHLAFQNMIDCQIRPYHVSDEKVLHAIETTPRENFVPFAYQAFSYADVRIPLGNEQWMLTPKEQAYILQALAIQSEDRILEVGTGSGYLTALLAKLGKRVESVDFFPEFVIQAKKNLAISSIQNIKIRKIDIFHLLSQLRIQEEFEIIVCNQAFERLPQFLFSGLAPKGRLFAIIGKSVVMNASLFIKQDDEWKETVLFETVTSMMPSLEQANKFIF